MEEIKKLLKKVESNKLPHNMFKNHFKKKEHSFLELLKTNKSFMRPSVKIGFLFQIFVYRILSKKHQILNTFYKPISI